MSGMTPVDMVMRADEKAARTPFPYRVKKGNRITDGQLIAWRNAAGETCVRPTPNAATLAIMLESVAIWTTEPVQS